MTSPLIIALSLVYIIQHGLHYFTLLIDEKTDTYSQFLLKNVKALLFVSKLCPLQCADDVPLCTEHPQCTHDIPTYELCHCHDVLIIPSHESGYSCCAEYPLMYCTHIEVYGGNGYCHFLSTSIFEGLFLCLIQKKDSRRLT